MIIQRRKNHKKKKHQVLDADYDPAAKAAVLRAEVLVEGHDVAGRAVMLEVVGTGRRVPITLTAAPERKPA